MAKRERLEIIRDMLQIVKSNHRGIKPTPLLRKANISSSRFREYYKDLLTKNFIRESNSKKSKRILLTEKGQRFLEKYQTILKFIEEFEL